MVRDEIDILEGTLLHLLTQDVDGIIVVDNGSRDGTVELLERLARENPRLHVGTDKIAAYHQAHKMTALAAAAARAGADWIVPFDADERWFGLDGTLAQALRAASTPVAVAVIHNLFPRSSESKVGDPDWQVDTSPARLQKVAFRWCFGARLHHGNHAVDRPGQPTELLRIIHVPWRGWPQFRNKIRAGAAALDERGARRGSGGDHWRDLDALDEKGLRNAWESLLEGHGPEEMEWIPRGTLLPCNPWGWSTWGLTSDPAASWGTNVRSPWDQETTTKIDTRSMNEFLYRKAMSFVPAGLEKVRMLGTGSLDYLQKLIEDESADVVINIDEDAFVTDIEALEELVDFVIQRGYANAGMSDGGVVPHRDFNPRTTNPFFNVFNTKLIREKYDSLVLEDVELDGPTYLDGFDLEPLRHPYRAGYHEEYDPLLVWISQTFPTLYLHANTHADGTSTILFNHERKPFLVHSWYTRTYGRDRANTRRVNRLINEAARMNPAGAKLTVLEQLRSEGSLVELSAARKAFLV